MTASVPSDTPETAWLAELQGEAPQWAILTDDDYDEHWTTDAGKALRFARREDAQAFIDHYGWTRVVPTEHMWCAPRQQKLAASQQDKLPAAADTGLVERLQQRVIDLELAVLLTEQREAAAREQIAVLERERDEALTEHTDMMWQRRRADERADAATASLSSAQETISRMKPRLMEAREWLRDWEVAHGATLPLVKAIDAALTLARETNDGQ